MTPQPGFKIWQHVRKITPNHTTYWTVIAIQAWKDGEVRITTTFESSMEVEDLDDGFDNEEEENKYFI